MLGELKKRQKKQRKKACTCTQREREIVTSSYIHTRRETDRERCTREKVKKSLEKQARRRRRIERLMTETNFIEEEQEEEEIQTLLRGYDCVLLGIFSSSLTPPEPLHGVCTARRKRKTRSTCRVENITKRSPSDG